jgi:hypothetical protein
MTGKEGEVVDGGDKAKRKCAERDRELRRETKICLVTLKRRKKRLNNMTRIKERRSSGKKNGREERRKEGRSRSRRENSCINVRIFSFGTFEKHVSLFLQHLLLFTAERGESSERETKE